MAIVLLLLVEKSCLQKLLGIKNIFRMYANLFFTSFTSLQEQPTCFPQILHFWIYIHTIFFNTSNFLMKLYKKIFRMENEGI